MDETVKQKVGRPKKPEKVTWQQILDDFKLRHPRLGKTIVRWWPSDIGEITILLECGDHIVYDYDWHRGRRIVKEED